MKKIVPVIFLIMSMLILCQCSGGNDGSDGDSDSCPDGQEMGPDGKCHTVFDGDVDDKTDGDTTDSSDGDTGVDGDIDEDVDKSDTDQSTDGDDDFDFEDKPDGDLDDDVIDTEVDSDDVVDIEQDQTEIDETVDVDNTEVEVEAEVEESSGSCVGAICSLDGDCGYGCHCSTGSKCAQECFLGGEFLCSSPGAGCCDYELGKCVSCVDGDSVEEEDPIDCPNGDTDCPQYMLCNGFDVCEMGVCVDNEDCKDTQYCTYNGRCKEIPEADDDDESVTRAYSNHCDVNEDCKSGYYCHWETNLCVPGCKTDDDCFVDAPTCKNGICY